MRQGQPHSDGGPLLLVVVGRAVFTTITTCGGLMMATNSSRPYMPRLDTVKLPPTNSSGLSLGRGGGVLRRLGWCGVLLVGGRVVGKGQGTRPMGKHAWPSSLAHRAVPRMAWRRLACGLVLPPWQAGVPRGMATTHATARILSLSRSSSQGQCRPRQERGWGFSARDGPHAAAGGGSHLLSRARRARSRTSFEICCRLLDAAPWRTPARAGRGARGGGGHGKHRRQVPWNSATTHAGM